MTRARLPKRIGRYAVLERIAVGQIAEVYTARRPRGGPVVCLKRIRPDVLDKPDLRAAFEQELELARQLRHPNIVEVYDVGEDDGYYFVMELIDGWDLDMVLNTTGPVEPRYVAFVGTELCQALIYIHHTDPETGRKPVAHCDVSPYNVFIGRDGTVKLSDFGVSKTLAHTGAEALTRMRGHVRYASPEQWRGEKLGTRTDLFSLGLVLWRMLIGTHPYAEDKPPGRRVILNAWIQQRTSACLRARTVREAAPDAPTALQDAIEALLQPVERRTETAEQVLEALCALAPLGGDAELAALLAAKGLR